MPVGPNGTESTISVTTASVSSAQLKNLGAAGVVVVPAVADKLISPIAATLLYHFGTVPYGTLAASDTTRDLALTVGGIAVTHWMSSHLAIQPSNDRATWMYMNDCSDAGGLPDTGGDFLPNTPIELWNWSGVEYTDGDGTLTVITTYHLIDV